ncbi:hypothetical protein NA78x_004596 [Anatilimnocola sp. NA78]|uniref:hypothetical protein n=1 Tax=Anatilimnocola sp. NA78 TaxID=3415683 RepID=UPI003CE4F399
MFGDFDEPVRRLLEQELGGPVLDSQKVVIKVFDPEAKSPEASSAKESPALPDWCNVYAGLSDAAVDRLDHATKQRLDLTRGTGLQIVDWRQS